MAALIVFTYAWIVALAFFTRPLGPDLVLPPPAAPQPLPPTPGGPPQCGGPPVMTLLAVAIDAPDGNYATGFADVIRVARVDYVTPAASVLTIPRDLWVAIPDLEGYGIVENRVKAAYTYGFEYDLPGGGPSLLARSLSDNFGLTVDHYLVVNFPAFAAGIDAIGGIDVDVAQTIGAPGEVVYFPAGVQHMDGDTALRYARLRGGASDLYRVERQTDVLLAIRQKALSPAIVPRLPGLVESMRASVMSDLTPAEISSLLCIVEKIDASAIQLVEIDPGMMTSDVLLGFEVLMPDYPAIREVVAAFQAGQPPP